MYRVLSLCHWQSAKQHSMYSKSSVSEDTWIMNISSPVSLMNGNFKSIFKVKLYQLKELCPLGNALSSRDLKNEYVESSPLSTMNKNFSYTLMTQRALSPRGPKIWIPHPHGHQWMTISRPYFGVQLKELCQPGDTLPPKGP